MDVSEHRKQYAEQLERAAEEGREGYRAYSDKSKPVHERLIGLQSAGALTSEEEVTEAIGVIRDREEDAELRAVTLLSIAIAVGQNPESMDLAIGLLTDVREHEVVRLAALQVLQASSFRTAAFGPNRSKFLAALRGITEESDGPLRQRALEILALKREASVQSMLLEGLRDPEKALVSPAKAVQLLGYDIHAQDFGILRDMVQNPPSPEAKLEAVRLLASDPDPTSKALLAERLNDMNESPEVRDASAIALRSQDPAMFEEQAKEILFREVEDDDIRATAITALTHFADQEALSQDAALTRRVEQLGDQSSSEAVERMAARFLSKQSEQ